MRGGFGDHTSLRFAIAKLLTEMGQEDELPWIGRATCLYTCRFIGRRQFRKNVKEVISDKDQVNRLAVTFKNELDQSIYKNHLLKAVHRMGSFAKKTSVRYSQTAYSCRVQEEDVRWFVSLLTKEELAELSKKFDHITVYSQHGVDVLLSKLKPHIKSLARRNLTYVTKYDNGKDREDMVAELESFAIYLIRLYEVKCKSEEHLLRTVNQGLTHQVANTSSAYGRPKRQPILRTHQRNTVKTAWWFNLKKSSVKKIEVDGVKGPRKLDKHGQLRVLVKLKSGKSKYAKIEELYNTKLDAVAARESYRASNSHVRALPLINLTPNDEDEYQITNTSLDQPRGESGATLLDFLPANLKDHNTEVFLHELSKHASERLSRFAELVIGDNPDGLFVHWLKKRNRNLGTMNLYQVGKEACRFLNCRLEDIQEDLVQSCCQLWSDSEINRIVTERDLLDESHSFSVV